MTAVTAGINLSWNSLEKSSARLNHVEMDAGGTWWGRNGCSFEGYSDAGTDPILDTDCTGSPVCATTAHQYVVRSGLNWIETSSRTSNIWHGTQWGLGLLRGVRDSMYVLLLCANVLRVLISTCPEASIGVPFQVATSR
jgi:hypothetical protein